MDILAMVALGVVIYYSWAWKELFKAVIKMKKVGFPREDILRALED